MSDPGLRVVPQMTVGVSSEDESMLAFSDFFEREKSGLFRAMCLVTHDRMEAEELTQDAFLRVFERWERVSRLEEPVGYLYRTAMNAFRSWHRRALLATRRSIGLASPDDRMREVDETDAVIRALAPLSPRQRAAVVLTDLLGYSSEEAGKVLGIRPATVRTHLSRAHADLKRTVERSRD